MCCIACLVQVLNSYGKVFPTQPPSGRPVREGPPPPDSQWERHNDEVDIENPMEERRSIGDLVYP